jgi:phosphoadenosine phosphosulfate reductase
VCGKLSVFVAPRLSSTPDDAELAALSESFEQEPAGTVVAWAVDTFGERLAVASSVQDAVLIDIAVRVDPSVEVVFIDTGEHFPETLETLERVRRRYCLNLRVVRVATPPVRFPLADPVNCCSAAKVAALEAALAGKRAWMSGMRRSEAPTRADAPIVSRDRRGLVKVNPLATWTDADIAGYVADHDVPYNPLLDQGYLSIGCAPCTRPVLPGEHPRAGRWAGTDKTECGIHV